MAMAGCAVVGKNKDATVGAKGRGKGKARGRPRYTAELGPAAQAMRFAGNAHIK